MRKALYTSLLACGLGVGVTACDLTGPKLSEDPNNPSGASNVSLLSAAQANMWVRSESDLARSICVWLQQCSGRNSQYRGVDNYSAIADGDFWYTDWAGIYGGGGLIDLRRIQVSALQSGDSTFAGIAAVMEAWFMGTAADTWGDVPYTQAALSTVSNPAPDPQQQVYAHVQAKLDSAIIYLSATSSRNIGPGPSELVYQGDRTKWLRMAQTLKARNFMHTAEQVPASYDSALVHAQQGILFGQDYNNFHTADLPSSNLWFQFFVTAAKNYMAAGAFLVDLLKVTGDPRLPLYFSPSPTDPSVYEGGKPGQNDTLTTGTISSLSSVRLAADFPQPLVTWAETRLIVAEASYSKAARDEATARSELNLVRATVPLPGVSASLTGQALLDSIMIEKYIQEFQNIEAWSDYRRTCVPSLQPPVGYARLPRRLPYPLSERAANTSIPDPGPDPFSGGNWNDPNPCP